MAGIRTCLYSRSATHFRNRFSIIDWRRGSIFSFCPSCCPLSSMYWSMALANGGRSVVIFNTTSSKTHRLLSPHTPLTLGRESLLRTRSQHLGRKTKLRRILRGSSRLCWLKAQLHRERSSRVLSSRIMILCRPVECC